MKTDTYNGWKNYDTWNVSLWINNDEALYGLMCETTGDYATFAEILAEFSTGTPDGVAWDADTLDYDALDDMLAEARA